MGGVGRDVVDFRRAIHPKCVRKGTDQSGTYDNLGNAWVGLSLPY